MRGGDSERQAVPVRGCLSVAVGGPMRSPNPREGIHGSPRIVRIYTYGVCGNIRRIWFVAGHWWGISISSGSSSISSTDIFL